MGDRLVFSDGWESRHSELVCHELGCGNVVHFELSKHTSDVDAYQMRCQGSESKLEQCEMVLGHGSGEMMTVDCTGE